MATKQFGKKRSCPNCGKNFYDLNKAPPKCPSCEFVIENKPPSRAKAMAPEKIRGDAVQNNTLPGSTPKPASNPDPDVNIEDTFEEDDDSSEHIVDEMDDTVIEDTSSIDNGDADVSEVKEHLEIENPIKD